MNHRSIPPPNFIQGLIAQGHPEFRGAPGEKPLGLEWFESQPVPMEEFVFLWDFSERGLLGTAVERSKVGQLLPQVAELIRSSEGKHLGLIPSYSVCPVMGEAVLDWVGAPYSLINSTGGNS